MLLPSIRMSFMVLPPELLGAYEKRKYSYNQTASKAEQIAITQFIRDGHLAGQIRKSRKIHMAKAELLLETAKKVMGDRASAQMGESGFSIRMELRTTLTSDELAQKAIKEGTAVIPLPEEESSPETAGIVLACTNVAESDYEEALKRLKKCLEE